MALSAGTYWAVFPAKLPLAIIGQTFAQGIDSYTFAAIPFFFLAGEVMNTGGISRRLLRLARAALGHVKGGLAHVNIVTNMVFAGVSGSAVADASAVGAVMIPAMKKEGYPAEYAAAVTAAAATIGPVIPPSIPMVIFGLLASTSIGKLFIGGVVPGLLMGVFLLVASWLLARRRNFPAGRWQGFRELLAAALDAALAVLTPFIVIAGLVFGVASCWPISASARHWPPGSAA
jgi:tripartite ATP-independent transporter DctM subunit